MYKKYIQNDIIIFMLLL